MPHHAEPEMPELVTPYEQSSFDALQAVDLVQDEVVQRRESGYDVDDVVERINVTDPGDRQGLLALVDEMRHAERADSWPYDEPDGLAEIRRSLTEPPAPVAANQKALADQLRAAWLGRIAGCNLGKPVEMGSHWTPAHIRDYLELAGAYPLRDYFPVLDPMPARFELRDNWPETTRGNVHGSARDDDIDYAILALHLLEQHGRSLTPEQVGAAWLSLFPLQQVYTAERAAYINLANGVTGLEVARHRNPYREWIGAQIRGDVFGYVLPGDPWAAAQLAYQDASLSHTGNGVYGEMWAAALVSAAFTAESARHALLTALLVVPPRSRLAAALRHVLQLHGTGLRWEDALDQIRLTYGHYSWVHTVNNAAVVSAGLLWGDGEVATALGRTVMSGWDTDSNGATVGSVAGILAGTAGLPRQLVDPLENRTRSALFGFDNSEISDLADRSHRLAVDGLR